MSRRRDRDGPDPEFDDRPIGAPTRGPNGCRMGGLCDGHGWVEVQPAYAARMHPGPEPLTLDATAEQRTAYALAARDAELARTAAENSCYPCKACATAGFYRWAAGCSAAEHDASRCERCIAAGDVPKRRRSA